MSAAGGRYRVMFRFRDQADDLSDDGPFDLRRDAIDHRNWFFGHSPDVVRCWLTKDGAETGAVLVRA